MRGWVLGVAALLTLLVYVPRLKSPLVWDDRALIAFNPALARPIPLRDFASARYFEFSKEYSWRPLSTFSYYALIRLFGLSPAALRAFTLFFHFLNGLLLFAILKRWKWSDEISEWSVALFWLHPAQVESLMCAAFNKEALAAFGLLLMISAHQRRRWTLAGIGLTWALLAKETGLAGLPLAMLFDFAESGASGLQKHLRAYLFYGAIMAGYLWLRFCHLPGPVQSLSALQLPFSERVFYALGGWITAVRLFVVPIGLRIEYFALPPGSWTQWVWRIGAGGALAALALAGALRLWKTDRKLAFFWLWPFPFLLMTSNLIPAGALDTRLMAERWLYLPLIGWSAAAAALLCRELSRRALIPLGMLAGVFFLLGASRASDWSDEPALWRGLEQVYPWSAKAAAGLGEAYARENRWQQALPEFEKAFDLRESHRDLLLAHYIPASAGLLRWEDPSLFRWLGQCEAQKGDLPRAEGYFRRSIQLDPQDGFSYRAMALYLAQAREYRQARQWTDEGLARDPHDDVLLQIRSRLPQ